MIPRTVLVVDDEAEIVESLRRTLRGEAYRFVGTTSALEARELVDRGGIDLIVADIDMPELNGLELVAHVRETRPEVVRVLLTGDASLESAVDAINRSEVHRYFTKPWRNDALRQSIRDALARLDELRRRAEVDAALETRARLLSALEEQYPGIGGGLPKGGIHELDLLRLRTVLDRVAMPALVTLLANAPSAPIWDEHTTTNLKGGGEP